MRRCRSPSPSSARAPARVLAAVGVASGDERLGLVPRTSAALPSRSPASTRPRGCGAAQSPSPPSSARAPARALAAVGVASATDGSGLYPYLGCLALAVPLLPRGREDAAAQSPSPPRPRARGSSACGRRCRLIGDGRLVPVPLGCPRGPPASTWPRGCGCPKSGPPRPRARRLEHLHQRCQIGAHAHRVVFSFPAEANDRRRVTRGPSAPLGGHLPQGGSEKYPLYRMPQSPHCHEIAAGGAIWLARAVLTRLAPTCTINAPTPALKRILCSTTVWATDTALLSRADFLSLTPDQIKTKRFLLGGVSASSERP